MFALDSFNSGLLDLFAATISTVDVFFPQTQACLLSASVVKQKTAYVAYVGVNVSLPTTELFQQSRSNHLLKIHSHVNFRSRPHGHQRDSALIRVKPLPYAELSSPFNLFIHCTCSSAVTALSCQQVAPPTRCSNYFKTWDTPPHLHPVWWAKCQMWQTANGKCKKDEI